jgi:hypothetical protein
MTEDARLLLPVNWRNALAYYAQGLLVPAGMLARCHKDLLELAPRRLPLLINEVSGSVAEMCAPTPGDFPVILEIDGDVSVHRTALDLGGAPAAVAPAGVIPISHVSRVHVRSDKDQEEFQARRYGNVDTSTLPVTVTLPLFKGNGASAEILSIWLRGLPDVGAVGWEGLVKRQCTAGGLMLVFASLPPEEGILESAGRLLKKVLSCPDTVDMVDFLPDVLADVGWIGREDDHSVCAAALEILVKISGPEPPVPSEVLGGMRRLLAKRTLVDARLVRAYLDRILAINRGDVEFTSFRQLGGLRAAKGLLLFLLRPDPAAAKSWLREDINAEHEVIAMAATFAGIAHRSAGLPSELRGSDTLQHLLYDWISSGVGGDDIVLPHTPTPVVTLMRKATSLVLTADSDAGTVLARYDKESNNR